MNNLCANCSKALIAGAAFCGHCGTAVTNVAPVATPAPVPTLPLEPAAPQPQMPSQSVAPTIATSIPPKKSNGGKIALIIAGVVISGIMMLVFAVIVLSSLVPVQDLPETEDYSAQSPSQVEVGDSKDILGIQSETYLTTEQVQAMKQAMSDTVTISELSSAFRAQFDKVITPVSGRSFTNLCIVKDEAIQYGRVSPTDDRVFVTNADLAKVKKSVTKLVDELSLYPIEWLGFARPEDCIGFVKEIKNDKGGTTIGHANRRTIVYTLDPPRNTIHHEFFHSAEGQAKIHAGAEITNWPTSDSAYSTNVTKLFNEPTKKGFISQYARYTQQEDRAETYGYIADLSAKRFSGADLANPEVQEKITIVKKFLYDLYPAFDDDFFNKVNR